MEIRAIAREDFESVLVFCELLHRESPAYRDAAVDPEKLRQLGELLLAHPERFCGLVALTDKRLIGMLIGVISEPYFGPGCLASDLALFVAPSHRGSLAAARLVAAFEAWARGRGAQAIQLGVTTGIHQERTVALYEQLGFHVFGVVCRRSLTGG